MRVQHLSNENEIVESRATRRDLAQALTEQRQRPLGTVLRVEREEEDPLPLAEAERAVRDRDLLRARAEEEREQLLAPPLARGHDSLEQGLVRMVSDTPP